MEQTAFPFLPRCQVRRIISGGQTGVDRAALDIALQLGIEHGGYCPRGRRAEDGRIPPQYLLSETESEHYHVRTEQNVNAADATLILYRHELRGGTKLTYELARRAGKPCLKVELAKRPSALAVRHWLAEREVATLNVAGPRESQMAGIYREARRFLAELLLGHVLDPGRYVEPT
jgi:hypothetical protein